jgi:hypothetical protein
MEQFCPLLCPLLLKISPFGSIFLIQKGVSMTTLKFNLKEPNGKSETLIYLFITVNGQRIKKSTHQKIHPELWDSKKKRVASNSRIILKHKRITPGIELRIRRIQESLDFLSKEVERFFHSNENR